MIRNSQLLINDINDVYVNRINNDGQSGNCLIRFFTGNMPQSTSFNPTGTNVFNVPLPDPAVQKSGNDLILLIKDVSAGVLASGRVSWWRFINKNGVTLFDGTAGLLNSNSDIEFSTINLEEGNIIRFTSNHVLKYGC